ncbi:MAG: type II toxin-antitoxin system VapC family toxin [Nocardioidaceae bacterium]
MSKANPAVDALTNGEGGESLRDNLTAYDAAYVALAEALECPLVTRDVRLTRSGGHSVEMHLH